MPEELGPGPGSRVLVVGASGGIGRATFRLLSRCEIVLGGHSFQHAERLAELGKSTECTATRLRLFSADLTSCASSEELIRSFVDWAGGIDVLIQLSGGVSRSVYWQELTEKEWNADLALNLSAPFFLARSAMRCMKAGGRIILTSTASAQHGGGSTTMAYGIAKAGVECLVKSLAREGAPTGILVNAISPGFIDTGLHTATLGRSPQFLKQRAELVPLKRAGTPLEVAGVILFLASPHASYITGQCLAVSGGDWL